MVEQISNANRLYDAFLLSAKQSDWKESVQRYEYNLLRNVFATQDKLNNRTYEQKPFFQFDINERGKHRHIKSLHISDRVVQRSLCDNVLTPKTNSKLIYDNGASVKGKGISFARKRMEVHLRKYYQENLSNEGYILQIDFKKFFDSIPHRQLLEQFSKLLDPEEFKLFEMLVKTFSCEEYTDRSVGIGSQISQICGISFPTPLDNYIKNVCGFKYYGRYMDDSYIIHKDKEVLQRFLDKYKKMADDLGLIVNTKKTQIVRLSHGFIFLQIKYNLLQDGTILRRVSRKAIARERRKLKKYRVMLDEGRLTLAQIVQAYASWRGSYKKYNSHNSIRCMDKLFNDLFGGIYYVREVTERRKRRKGSNPGKNRAA